MLFFKRFSIYSPEERRYYMLFTEHTLILNSSLITSSLIGWGVLLDRMEGLGQSGGGALTAAFFEDSLLIAGARKLPVHAWQQDLFLHRK